jgi:hypothetical protein
MRGWVALAYSFFVSAQAQAMTFSVEMIDMRPVDLAYYVFASGPIVDGDTERLLDALQSAKIAPGHRMEIYLNSPGGSLPEGIKLGRMISGLGANTYVGRQTPDPLKPLPGECSSACVVAYLGGAYRHLDAESKIGVHQFALANGKAVEPVAAAVVSQVMAAEVIEFIRQSRADTKLFGLMTSALPSSIYFVPHDQLRELRVVTDDVLDEEWSFEYEEGVPYLQIWQQSYFGENKLLLLCEQSRLVGAAFVEPPPTHAIGTAAYSVGLFINGDLRLIPQQFMLQPPQFRGKFATAFFHLTPELAAQLLNARSIGTAMQPPNKDIFFGFQIGTAKGQDKLSKMILGCRQR